MADKTKSELLADVRDAQRRESQARADLDRFKRDVRELAIETAREQGWCYSGLNDALEQLGLERVVTKYSVRAVIELDFMVEIGDDFDHASGNVEEYLRSQLRHAVSDVSVDDYSNDWSFQGSGDCTAVAAEAQDD